MKCASRSRCASNCHLHPLCSGPAPPCLGRGATGSSEAMLQGHTYQNTAGSQPTGRSSRTWGRASGGDGGQGAAAGPRKWLEIAGTCRPWPRALPLASSQGRCQRGDCPAAAADMLLPLKASHLTVLKCWAPAF